MAKKVSLGVVTLLAVLVSAAHAQPVVRDGLLADSAGRTVYTFDKDTAGKSNCSGGCLAAWPIHLCTTRPVAQMLGLID